jgi:hypothetical protein
MRLWHFLEGFNQHTIYADWPEDFAHLMHWLTMPGGVAPNLELCMRLINSGDLQSKVPHNALEDARSLMRWHTGVNRRYSASTAMTIQTP